MRLVAVTGHTRLARRGAVYYHRAAIPQHIKDSYPKAEETSSLKTKDRAVALRLVRLAAVEVDRRFEAHRRKIRGERIGVQDELTPDQVAAAKAAYYRYLLDEDEDIRLDGFVELDDEGRVIGELPEAPAPTFEEHGQAAEDLAASTRYEYARGKADDFWQGEADEVLGWQDVAVACDRVPPRSAVLTPRKARATGSPTAKSAASRPPSTSKVNHQVIMPQPFPEGRGPTVPACTGRNRRPWGSADTIRGRSGS